MKRFNVFAKMSNYNNEKDKLIKVQLYLTLAIIYLYVIYEELIFN